MFFVYKNIINLEKEDIIKVRKDKYDYSGLIKYYKRKLVDYEVMKEITGVKSKAKYTSTIKAKDMLDKINLTA